MVKILVIRLSSIGDIVLTSPVVRCLKNQVPDAEIHFVAKQKFSHVVASNPYIDKIHTLGSSVKDLIPSLKEEKYDFIIDLHQNFRSNRIKSALRVKSYSVNKLNFRKFLLVHFKIDIMPSKHMVDRYMETVAPLRVKNDGGGLDFFIPEEDRFTPESLPESHRNGYIAFVIAGTYSTKKLPVDKIAEICRSVEHPVILLGGKKEREEAAKVVELTNEKVLNLAGRLSLNQSASLVRDARVVLTNDTGLMHIAAAFQKKILSFWGNTVPAFGMVPYQANPASERLEVKDLKCRPCSKLGYHKCPRKHFKCMNDLNVQEAVRWIQKNF